LHAHRRRCDRRICAGRGDRIVLDSPDQRVPLREVFPEADEERLRSLAAAANGAALLDCLEELLRRVGPETSKGWEQAVAITDRIVGDATLRTVEQTAMEFHTHPRTLQRLFREYVGVSPKWMIRRCRIQEAAALVEARSVVNWAGFAASLGYFDQAHFVNDFRAIVGHSPVRHERSVRR
jgi:AraC-like DNA-binding protein